MTTATAAESTTTSTAGSPASKSGADFRGSIPKTQPSGESADGPRIGSKEVGVAMESSGRFGMAGKPTQKVSFRIFSNLTLPELSLRPYGGLCKEGEFCIKPGGVNGAIKPFTAASGRKQYKKVGIRVEYSFKQLLSVRHKLKKMPSDIEPISMVLEEGLGVFEVLETQKAVPSRTVSKLRERSELPSASKSGDATDSAAPSSFTKPSYDNEVNDDQATFRTSEPVSMSKLKKKPSAKLPTDTGSASTTSQTKAEPVTPRKEPQPTSLSNRSKNRRSLPSSSDITETPRESRDSRDTRDSNRESARPTPSYSEPATDVSQPVAAPAKPSGPGLSKRAGGWKGRRGKQKVNLDPMAQLHKKITIRLNKITMDNFETLAGQLEEIYDSQITNTEQLTKLVTLIFEKTVQEHVYGPLYAKLCVTLSSKEKGFDEMVRTDYGMETIQVDFKNVLVKVCQTEFQKGKRPPHFTSDMDAQDRENEKIKVKKILLGTMKFIGQLYLSELLPPRVMTLCLKHLIIPSGQKPSDDDVEAACTLLSTVGPALDEDKNLKKQELNKYYQRLASVSKNSSYSQRIRIVIQNLNDLRKKGWTDSRAQKAEGPKRLDKSKKASRVAMRLGDDDDVFMMGMEQFIGQGGDDALEMIHADVVPIASHVVGQSERNLNKRGRYGGGAGQRVSDDKRSVGRRRNPRNTGGRWKLLDSKEDEEQTGYSEEVSMDMDYGGGGGYDNAMEAQPAVSGVGRRKHRTALSANTSRPCDDGKVPDEDKLNDIMGDYYEMKANEETTISSLVMYQIADREKFLLSNIRRAIDNRKGERLSQLIPKLLDEYIVVASELDGAFIEFFKGYTMEDNPQINKYAPQLLANLLVDKELDFSDLLGWILLDTREAQPQDDMLQFYDKDGIRNCIRGSKTITKALDLLGYLFKELKEVCFEDQEYVKKLLIAHNFEIDKYMDQSDLANKAAVEEEWIDKYKLKFAF